MNLLDGTGPRWRPKATLAMNLGTLGVIFEAIEVYRSRVQKNATEVKIIATRPGRALALDRELANAGWQTPHPEETDESISNLFAGATRSILVMTPFLDQRGSGILKSLLGRAHKEVEITLILRYLDRPERKDYPQGFPLLLNWFRERRVRVFNYSLAHSPDMQIETFHAKLFLVDGAQAYVGSANMTGSSFDTSVELGVILAGEAARQLSRLVDVILRCATPWSIGTG
jgi:phosphatidylserine/phosphatidylglycerophosphate/cardiolipin synthase-like enzyme